MMGSEGRCRVEDRVRRPWTGVWWCVYRDILSLEVAREREAHKIEEGGGTVKHRTFRGEKSSHAIFTLRL